MNITLKALGALLTYPTLDLQNAVDEIATVIDAEPLLSKREREALHELLTELSACDLIDLQQSYVALFDRGRSTSLNLFEHVHGESAERGPAMIDLMGVYARSGFSLASNELPDYLPAMLEFLSYRPFPEAVDMLSDCAHILRSLGETLRSRATGYDAVPAALLSIIGAPGLSRQEQGKDRVAPAIIEEKSLDDDWMDAPVIFGPEGAPNCKPVSPATATIKIVPRQH